MSLPPHAEEALQAFSACQSWEQRARLLLQWGARLPPLTEAECCSANRVHGCESLVWLSGAQVDQGWQFAAASDARLLRGLLALLLLRVNGLDSNQLAQIDLNDWFNQLGLSRQLTNSRSNGLNAVLQRMRDISQA